MMSPAAAAAHALTGTTRFRLETLITLILFARDRGLYSHVGVFVLLAIMLRMSDEGRQIGS
jgi:hypothetical protein